MLHWAKTLEDADRTACRLRVGNLLADGDDITADTSAFLCEGDVCDDCLAELEEE